MTAATVPAGPFVRWLRGRIETVGRETVRGELLLGGEALAALLELGDDAPIDVGRVDRFLTRADADETLATLYPADEPAERRRADHGRSYVCDEATLVRAHALHMDGMSVNAVAREFFGECFSSSPKALTMAFLNAFRARGWEVRSQREATAASNRTRAWRPRCEHVIRQGARKGERCARRAQGNDRWCWHHRPDRIVAGVARLRAGVGA